VNRAEEMKLKHNVFCAKRLISVAKKGTNGGEKECIWAISGKAATGKIKMKVSG
jgi:hypothetical protein